MILVTGGAGFIGANFVLDWLAESSEPVLNLDALTYAGNLESLSSLDGDPRHVFVHGDITDRALLDQLFATHKPRAVVHFAAESHVDRSIHGPGAFIHTNVQGTFTLLEAARGFWSTLAGSERERFRFHHVSTDEVYGSLGPGDAPFTETHLYEPNSPYSASKAASDHLVSAWHHTYGLPVVLTNCSNNYGPWQFPEKLIPVVILKAVAGEPIPLYGDGANVRDWLYVEDHVEALLLAATRGRLGESYCVGGAGDHGSPSERTNRDVVETICALMDQLRPQGAPHARLITRVGDRPGHDRRYAIDAAKITTELGWKPRHSFEQGLEATVRWYLEHLDWCGEVRDRAGYSGERIGEKT